MSSMIRVGPLPEPSDVADGRGWRVISGDGVEHRVQLGRFSLLWGPPRSFDCDGSRHRLRTFLGFLRVPSTTSFLLAGQAATISVDAEFEGNARTNLWRNLTNPRVWLAQVGGGAGRAAATMAQRDRRFTYTLTVADTDGGSWVALLPDNIPSSWQFVSGGGDGDHRRR